MNAEGREIGDKTFALVLEAARGIGSYGGRSAGSWVLDGNSSEEDARSVLEQIENCEFDVPPSPISGQWSDDLPEDDLINDAISQTVTVGDLDDWEPTEWERDEIANAFIDAWTDAYQAEAERSARAMLS